MPGKLYDLCDLMRGTQSELELTPTKPDDAEVMETLLEFVTTRIAFRRKR